VAEDKKKPVKPELIPKGNSFVPNESQPLAETLSPFSTVPFYSRFRQATVRAWRRLVREETGLADDLVGHQKSLNRLKDVGVEIETERLQRQDELEEAQRTAALKEKKDRVAQLKLDFEEAELLEQISEKQKRINDLKSPAEKKSKIDSLKEQLKEKILRDKIYQDYELEKLKLKIRKELKNQQAIDNIFNEVIDEIFHGKDPEDFTEEEGRKYGDFEAFYKNLRTN